MLEVTRIFQLADANAEVTALLRTGGVLRFFGFGEAPQNVAKPYAIWQLVGGSPENKLAGVPNEDTYTFQVDAYGDTGRSARDVGVALRAAFESDGYVVSYNFEGREPETRLYRFSFNVELMLPRDVES